MASVTISRQVGSGGDEIASKVCEALGYRYFDKRLMAQVAAELGIAEHELVDYSEDEYELKSFIDALFGRSRPVTTVTARRRDTGGAVTASTEVLDEERCIGLIRAAVNAAHKRSNIVIVGRGGQAILQDAEDVLHVRITAPTDDRVKRLQEEGTDEKKARRTLAERDKAAAQYLESFYGIQWDDPNLYCLTINTGKINLDLATDLIVEAVKKTFPVPSA